jgi:hypothetical protein
MMKGKGSICLMEPLALCALRKKKNIDFLRVPLIIKLLYFNEG